MQSFLSFVAAVLLATPAFATPVPEIESAQDGYLSTCSILSTDGQWITTSCGDGHGNNIVSTVNLDTCLGNENGVIVIPSAQFSASCFNINWNGPTLCACCNNFQNTCLNSCIATNSILTNRNGVLTCP